MGNFFTRLAERSLGLSPVVQPAIAPRFGSAPAMTDEVAPRWNSEVEYPFTPGDPNPSDTVSLQVDPTVQEQLSPPELGSTTNLVQGQAQPYSMITSSLPSQSIPPASNLSKPSSRQPVLPAANSIAPTQAIVEELVQSSPLKPFRVLPPRQPVLIETHPTLAIAPPNSEGLNTSEIISNRSRVQPITPQNRSDRLIENQQASFTQPPDQINLRSAESSPPFPPVSAEPTAAPPTIRVSIGRVEIRAIMPAPPAPKAAPVRPRPTVSLNDYLKQRGNKP